MAKKGNRFDIDYKRRKGVLFSAREEKKKAGIEKKGEHQMADLRMGNKDP